MEGRYLPNGFAFTALSHDIIAHEITHALLDGLRSNFMTPSSPDTLAFHEGFADLIAVFHHFSYEEVVLAALQDSNGQVDLLGRHADRDRELLRTYDEGRWAAA